MQVHVFQPLVFKMQCVNGNCSSPQQFQVCLSCSYKRITSKNGHFHEKLHWRKHCKADHHQTFVLDEEEIVADPKVDTNGSTQDVFVSPSDDNPEEAFHPNFDAFPNECNSPTFHFEEHIGEDRGKIHHCKCF